MASIFDVARYILRKQKETTVWKLQKLCFYAQAWELAWTEKELFPEDFEAWPNGPVCPELCKELAGRYYVRKEHLPQGDPDILDEGQKETVDIIIRDYGNMEPGQLRELVCAEDPWKDTFEWKDDGRTCCKTISKEAMGLYYGSL